MVSDVPVISYTRNKRKVPSKKEMDDLKQKWLERKKNEKRVDLNSFLRAKTN
jgi:hypothetical protein